MAKGNRVKAVSTRKAPKGVRKSKVAKVSKKRITSKSKNAALLIEKLNSATSSEDILQMNQLLAAGPEDSEKTNSLSTIKQDQQQDHETKKEVVRQQKKVQESISKEMSLLDALKLDGM